MSSTAAEAAPGAPLADIRRLIDVLERENAALIAGDRAAVRGLADEKRLACRAWDQVARAMAESAEPALDIAARRHLRPALDRLAEASAENRRRLAAAIAAHKRLLEIVADGLRTLEPAAGAYARNGAPVRRAAAAAPPRAVSFDRAM